MINNRYILGERLFGEGKLGELYIARDSLAFQNGTSSQVLLHFIPGVELKYADFHRVCEQLLVLSEAGVGKQVLQVQDFGWTGEKGYFVLAAPDAWLVTVLPPLTPVPTSLHQRANQLV
ncbi:MAG: hypothetical protein ACPGSM_21745, partial [Thiolinea sp.]